MACLRCRLKPVARNNYGTLIEYTAPLPNAEEDPVLFVLPAQQPGGPNLLALFKPEARACRLCGTVYCEPMPPPAPPPQPVRR